MRSDPNPARAACAVCGGGTFELFAEERGYPLYRCSDCRVVFVHPQPSSDALRALYENRSRQGEPDDYYGNSLRRETGLRQHARTLLKILGPPRACARLLEIGCGAGFFLDEARRLGWKVRGIEVNRLHAEYAREKLGLDVEGRGFEECDLAPASFEAVCMFDLLSHLRDPAGCLALVAKALAGGGRLLLQAGAKAENARKPEGEDWETPLHLFHFTEASLRGLLEESGFLLQRVDLEGKIRLPALLGSPRVGWLRERMRPFLPLARRILRTAQRGRATDHTVHILALTAAGG